MKWAKGTIKITILKESGKDWRDLGRSTMSNILDDQFLEERLVKITLGGCWTCAGEGGASMCVDDTYSALVKEYGKEHVEIDPNITLKAGMYIQEDKGN